MKRFEPVYVSRATFDRKFILVVPAHIGIVKLGGCYYFAPAVKTSDGEYWYLLYEKVGGEEISLSTCRRRYGSIPASGEAWLVEEGNKYINWTREDQNMHLLDEKGKIVKE